MRASVGLVLTLMMSALLARGARIAKQRNHNEAAHEVAQQFTAKGDLVEIVPDSQKQLDAFLSMPEFGPDDWESLSADRILVYTTKDTRAALEKAGLKYASAEDPNVDLASLTNYTYASGSQDWRQYCGYNCMTSRLRDLSRTCGYSLESIGRSRNGREIWVMQIGSGAPKVMMAANIHGDETVGGQLLQRWMWETCFEPSRKQAAVARYAVLYMPMMNPDGYESQRRGNARGVDLNRDFPEPGERNSTSGRQPETVAFMNYVSRKRSVKVSSMAHGGAVVINYGYDACYTNIPGLRPCGSNGRPPALAPDNAWLQQLSRAWTFPAGYRCLFSSCITNGASWYQIRGSLQDYNYYHNGIMDITLELSTTKRPSGRQLPGFYTDNYQAIYNFIETGNRGRGR